MGRDRQARGLDHRAARARSGRRRRAGCRRRWRPAGQVARRRGPSAARASMARLHRLAAAEPRRLQLLAQGLPRASQPADTGRMAAPRATTRAMAVSDPQREATSASWRTMAWFCYSKAASGRIPDPCGKPAIAAGCAAALWHAHGRPGQHGDHRLRQFEFKTVAARQRGRVAFAPDLGRLGSDRPRAGRRQRGRRRGLGGDITAQRLDAARATIQPQLGASTYSITSQAIETLPGGDNTPLNQVILQAPGVAQDSYGQLHIRGEHNGLQFRLNGVILPEGLSVFSQALSPRLADKRRADHRRPAGRIRPAHRRHRRHHHQERRLRTAASVSLYGGSHGEIEPSFEYGGTSGETQFLRLRQLPAQRPGHRVAGRRSDPLHDHTDQFQGFAYLDDIIDPDSRVSLILGTSDQTVPDPGRRGRNGGLTSDGADRPEPAAERQRPDQLSRATSSTKTSARTPSTASSAICTPPIGSPPRCRCSRAIRP